MLIPQSHTSAQPHLAHAYDNTTTNAFIPFPDDPVQAENLRHELQEFRDFCRQGSQAGASAQGGGIQVPTLQVPFNFTAGFDTAFNSWNYPTEAPALPFPFTYDQPTEQMVVPGPYLPQEYGSSTAVGQVPPQWQMHPAPPTQPMAWSNPAPTSAAGQQVVFQPPLEQSQTEPWKKPVHTLPTRHSKRHSPYPRPSPPNSGEETGVKASHKRDEFFECRWETPGSCTHNLGVEKSDVRDHFMHNHFPHLIDQAHISEAWQAFVQCKWHSEGGLVCGTLVKLTSLANHISAVHSKSVQHVCKFCGREFSRKDAARRHERARKDGRCPEGLGRPLPGKPTKKKKGAARK